MCYYALSIFLGCGHAIQSQEPLHGPSGCRIRRARRSVRTPSLSESIDTQPSPRSTIGSAADLPDEPEIDENTDLPCGIKMSHPLHTHRVLSLCGPCWEQARGRLDALEDMAVVDVHQNFIAKAKRDKVVLEGRRPRQLHLVTLRNSERTELAEVQSGPTSPQSVKDKNIAATMDYVRGLWGHSKVIAAGMKSPASLRGTDPFIDSDAPVTVKKKPILVPESCQIALAEDEPG